MDTKTQRWKGRGQPVEYKGVVYRSGAALARHVGCSTTLIGKHLERHGHLDYLGVGTGRGKQTTDGSWRFKPIELFGRKFPSITAAAEYMGVTRSTIYNRLRHNTPQTKDLILRDLIRAEQKMERQADENVPDYTARR